MAEDLLALLHAQLQEEPDEGMTVTELAERSGRHPEWIRNRLKSLLKEGRVEVGKKAQRAMDGRIFRVPAYRLKRHDSP